jgi:hypothetical protein
MIFSLRECGALTLDRTRTPLSLPAAGMLGAGSPPTSENALLELLAAELQASALQGALAQQFGMAPPPPPAAAGPHAGGLLCSTAAARSLSHAAALAAELQALQLGGPRGSCLPPLVPPVAPHAAPVW